MENNNQISKPSCKELASCFIRRNDKIIENLLIESVVIAHESNNDTEQISTTTNIQSNDGRQWNVTMKINIVKVNNNEVI